METKTKGGGLLLRVAIAIIMAVSGAACAIAYGGAQDAYASESAYLEVGGSIYYGGYSTNWMYSDGEMAYCGNPSSSTPGTGTYERSAIDAPSGRNLETAADLWFSYGSPGFDASMWPDTWYDGSEMSPERYAALSHILLSDTFSSDGEYALHGCSQEFKDWARQWIIGFDGDGNEINAAATGRVCNARQGEVPSNFHPYMLYTGDGSQLVVSFTYVPNGSIDLTKASANTAISDGNDCYSVEGATYGVFSDAGCTASVASIVTDGAGYGKADDIPAGSYWVCETDPSDGMAKDASIYPVTVEGGQTAHVNGGTVYDYPQSDPVPLLLCKVDSLTDKGEPQGDAGIEGALFEVAYYDGDYATAQAAKDSGGATRTWTFETDSDGFAYYSDEFLHSGDALYRQSDGKTAALPIGTVLITEVSAPEGYNLDDGMHNAPETYVVHITGDGSDSEGVYTYNTKTTPDSVQRGDCRLMKEVPTTNDDEDQELTRIPVEGVRFQIINDSDSAVVSPETLEEVEHGGVVMTIVTNENGLATTAGNLPEGWTGALAYGNYTVHEVIPADVAKRVLDEYGITLIGVADWEITIAEEGQYDPVQIVANHIPQTPITIQKVDSTTGKAIPLACSFQLYDEDGNLVSYTDHMADKVIDTWTTLSTGKVTLPMKLDEGTYTLVEVASPEGYVLGTDSIEFTVDEYRTWDDPIVVTYRDAPIRGAIDIAKADADTGAAVAGAEYCVKAAEDIVTGDGTTRFQKGQTIAHVTTDADGHALIEGLYLGTYTVYETKSPEGLALDTSEHTVTIASEGQTVPVVTHAFGVADKPTKVRVLKVDATDETNVIEGATFHIWQTDVEDGYDETFVTDADGLIVAGHLPHGEYLIEETEAPDGYYIADDAAPVAFEVDDQGFIGLAAAGSPFSDTLELSFENAPTTVEITKADLTSGVELPGATLVLTDKAGDTIEEWVSTDEAHVIHGLIPGEYVLTETIAPEGYLLTTAVAFTVQDTGDVQKVVMTDDYTKTDFSKTDATTGAELAGAHLQVIDASGTVIAEWDTDGTTHRINGLKPGDYTLRETSAPDGYEVTEEVAFTVQADGEVHKVEMTDEKTPSTPGSDMPKTGDDLPLLPIAALLGALGCAAGAVALAKHRGRKDGDDDSDKGTVEK